VWVLGDNRQDSRDSTFFGPIPENSIVGRAFVKIWPLNDLSLL
jgi:signal peptidase I